jgi:hypothetical protein
MDQDKYGFFLAKYRALDADDLSEAADRLNSLSEEAAAALRAVLAERGQTAPPPTAEPIDEPRELSAEARELQTRLSSDLWNGLVAKRVRFLFSAQGMVLAYSLLGPQGLRLGALPMIALAALLVFAGSQLARTESDSKHLRRRGHFRRTQNQVIEVARNCSLARLSHFFSYRHPCCQSDKWGLTLRPTGAPTQGAQAARRSWLIFGRAARARCGRRSLSSISITTKGPSPCSNPIALPGPMPLSPSP